MPSHANSYQIAALPGDGIGPEVMLPCRDVISAAEAKAGGFSINLTEHPAGAAHYQDTGVALPNDTLKACETADAILLAAMGLPHIRYPDGTEIAPQIDLRMKFGLYAGVRPVKSLPGTLPVLADERAANLDFVLIRESTEGLFASKGKGTVVNDEAATETLVITRKISEKLFDFAFHLAQSRKRRGSPGNVTLIDKANVFSAFAFQRQIFEERAQHFPDIAAEAAYVDATALNMVRRPWTFDVLVTENMFGDILSDLGAGLIGGMGMAPSADIGDTHAVFQPCHGTAPDIVGQGKANPTAMFLSAAMMLDWLGVKHDNANVRRAGLMIETAVANAFRDDALRSVEHGGDDGTDLITASVLKALEKLNPNDFAA